MTADPAVPASSEDARHAAALAEYQSALELGLPVERAAFAARFPDLTGLEADLAALDALHRASDATALPAAGAEPTPIRWRPPSTSAAASKCPTAAPKQRNEGRRGLAAKRHKTQKEDEE